MPASAPDPSLTNIGSGHSPRTLKSKKQPLARLQVADWGDVDVVPGQIEDAFAKIERVIGAVLDSGALPPTMGGDGAGTPPQIRAVHRKFPDLVVLHLDSHTDSNPFPETGHDTGSAFTRAAPEGLVAHIRGKCGGRPVYLCSDMDVFDPSCAPGVCAPSSGGMSAREGFAILRGIGGLDIVAMEVNTISPTHDVGGMSAPLASPAVLLSKPFAQDDKKRHERHNATAVKAALTPGWAANVFRKG